MNHVDELKNRLVNSDLMTAEAAERHLAKWRDTLPPDAQEDAQDLINWLSEENYLTDFQADALRAGHSGPFMLGPYRVFERLATGWLGNVYRAVHSEFEQPVTLKVFPISLQRDPEKLARMQREARASVELEHPNIVRSFQIGQAEEVYYMAFEDLRGETLQDKLDRQGALPYQEAARLMYGAALALAHLHEHDMVHRDVRPANMWVTEGGSLKLMEFGAVRGGLAELDGEEEDGLTTSETVLGNVDYMSPEQAQDPRQADHRSDIYSLGCTLYHCLTGNKPFPEKNPIRLVMRHATELPPSLLEVVPGIPETLSETVDSMMAKSPDERFQSAKDVAWSMEQYFDVTALQSDKPEEVRADFLAWLSDPASPESQKLHATRSPELADFLAWMAARQD